MLGISKKFKILKMVNESSHWYFATRFNAQIKACQEYLTNQQSIKDSRWNPRIVGFTDGIDAQAQGIGIIHIAVKMDEQMVFFITKDICMDRKQMVISSHPAQQQIKISEYHGTTRLIIFHITRRDQRSFKTFSGLLLNVYDSEYQRSSP